MFLAKWTLNANDYRLVGAYDNYAMHQIVCEIFDTKTVKFDISNQTNGMVTILMQCDTNVVNIPTIGNFQCKEVDLTKCDIGTYRIMVKLNAVKQHTIEGKKNKKKVPIVGEANITNWLMNNQSKWGIDIQYVSVSPTIRTKAFKKKTKDLMVVDWHEIDMMCNVTDATMFQNMISRGIGSSRSLGCSMVMFFKVSN